MGMARMTLKFIPKVIRIGYLDSLRHFVVVLLYENEELCFAYPNMQINLLFLSKALQKWEKFLKYSSLIRRDSLE